MNEQDLSDRFNRDIDNLLTNTGEEAGRTDPQLLNIAARLAEADFSGESKIRNTLKAGLLEKARNRQTVPQKQAVSWWKIPVPLSAWAPVVTVCLAVALSMPLMNILINNPGSIEPGVSMTEQSGRAREKLAARTFTAPAITAKPAADEAPQPLPPFDRSGKNEEFPIQNHTGTGNIFLTRPVSQIFHNKKIGGLRPGLAVGAGASVFVTVSGRVSAGKNSREIVWEGENVYYSFFTRNAEQIFETRTY